MDYQCERGGIGMTTKLAENIRTYRKERGFTQEQLAEALGVTTGAVYKWEAEKSLPEIGMLVELADFFDVSVDVLLGYEIRRNDKDSIVERLKTYMHGRSSEESLVEAEKALKKYPNSFEIVYRSACVYRVRGYDFQRQECYKRALELYEKAMRLIDQNTDEAISELSIQRDIAEIYVELGENEKSIEILKKNNPARMNHALIGNVLATGCGKHEEAAEYLSLALMDSIVSQIFIVTGFANIYWTREDYKSVIDISEWMISLMRGLKIEDKCNFTEKVECMFLAMESDMFYRLGQKEKAAEYLQVAKKTAERFDASPYYGVQHLRFIEHDETASAHDSLGETAMMTIEKYVAENGDMMFKALWHQIKETEA